MSKRDVAIVGIGATEFSKKSGRSELRLAIEAIKAASRDAGINPASIDGLVSYDMDNSEITAIARGFGVPHLTFFASTPWGGGGGCGTVAIAAAAVARGYADTVVCYRAMNERSQQRLGQAPPSGSGIREGLATGIELDMSWCLPFGQATAAGWMAPLARRYMHDYGATSEDFGRVAVSSRDFASTNPAAWFFKRPITLEEHQQSRMISDPLRLLDCCQESDGAVALIVTSAERAADLRQKPVFVAGASQGMADNVVGMASPYSRDYTFAREIAVAGDQVWKQSGLSPSDIDVAIIYDHFSFSVFMQLEALGFCGRGEGPDMVRQGVTSRGGALPVNTHGGQLGEAYLHGFNGIAEGVRQLRGSAANQVTGAKAAFVTSGSAVPTSALALVV